MRSRAFPAAGSDYLIDNEGTCLGPSRVKGLPGAKEGPLLTLTINQSINQNVSKLRHLAKFRRNRSNRGRGMTIFRFFQDGGRPPSWICCVSD